MTSLVRPRSRRTDRQIVLIALEVDGPSDLPSLVDATLLAAHRVEGALEDLVSLGEVHRSQSAATGLLWERTTPGIPLEEG